MSRQEGIKPEKVPVASQRAAAAQTTRVLLGCMTRKGALIMRREVQEK